MSFPGTYNIGYYYGDTYEFRVFPKNSAGDVFTLENFDTVKFTLAPTRGADLADQIPCYAVASSDNTNVLCAIRPEDAENLDPTIQYVYDVEITRATEPYDIVYTLLTGNVTITRDITLQQTAAPGEPPGNPTNLNIGTVTGNSIQVSWSAPTTGGDLNNYKLAIIPFTTDTDTLESTIESSTTLVDADTTSETFTGLDQDTSYSVIILGSGPSGDADVSSLLTNENQITTTIITAVPDEPTIDSLSGLDESIEVVFTAGNDNNATITNYEYSIDGSTYTAFDPAQTSSPLTITGLTNGTLYSVSIKAVNSEGTSDSSNTLTATPGAVPDAPTIDFIGSLDEGLQVFFTEGDDGGFSITNYEYSIDNGSTYTAFDPAQSSSPLTISGLSNNTEYDVSIKAVNSIGTSPASNTVAQTPLVFDFVVTNDGSSAYLVDGVANDTITVIRGESYVFQINASGHPFWIQTVSGYDSEEEYSVGVTNNGTEVGNIFWTVDQSTPNTLYYACQVHTSMGGTINVIDGGS